MDGETLVMLSTMGTVEQFKACGLNTVKDQMKLRKLVGKQALSAAATSSSSSASGSTPATASKGKLTKKHLAELTPEDKRVYLMM